MSQTAEQVGDTKPFRLRPRILLADEHSETRQYLTRLLSEHYEVDAATDGPTALTLARKRVPDLVVADVMTGTVVSMDLLHEFRGNAWGKVPIILYAPPGDEDSCVSVTEAGANDY